MHFVAGHEPHLFVAIGPPGIGKTRFAREVTDELERSGAIRGYRAVVDPAAQARYNARVQQAMQGTVWTAGGCASWYIDKHGRNTTLWPGFTFKFRELTRSFDREHYALRPAPVREREEVMA